MNQGQGPDTALAVLEEHADLFILDSRSLEVQQAVDLFDQDFFFFELSDDLLLRPLAFGDVLNRADHSN